MTDPYWKADLVIDFIQSDDWDEEKRRTVRVVRGQAFARGIEDASGRYALAIGSTMRNGRRIYYLLGDDFPEDKRVAYDEAPGYVELAKHLMRRFGFRGDVRIEWEIESTDERPLGHSQTVTVP